MADSTPDMNAEPVTPAAPPSNHVATVVERDGFRIESSSLGHDQAAVEAAAESVLSPPEAEAADAEPTPGAATADGVQPPTADPAKPAADASADRDEQGRFKKGRNPRERGEKHLETLQTKLGAATRELREAERQLEARRRELAGGAPPPPSAVPATAPAAPEPVKAPADDPRPRWSGANGFDAQGKTYEEFEEALGEWDDRQTERRVAAAAAKVAATAKQQTEAERAADFRRAVDARRNATFDDLVKNDPEFAARTADTPENADFLNFEPAPFLQTVIDLHPQSAEVLKHLAQHPADGYAFNEIKFTDAMKEAFRVSENPVRLIEALANDSDAAQRIARMDRASALRALTVLELQPADANHGSSPAAPRSPAPPLPARVGGSRSVATTRPLSQLTTSEADVAEFIRRRNAGEAVS